MLSLHDDELCIRWVFMYLICSVKEMPLVCVEDKKKVGIIRLHRGLTAASKMTLIFLTSFLSVQNI